MTPSFSPYFVSFEDYQSNLPLQKLRNLVQQDQSARLQAEREAEAAFREKLGVRYDMDLVLAARGAQRNPSLLRHMVAVTLYYLYARVVNKNVPPIREKAYKEAMAWCDAAVKGSISVDLPVRLEPETNQPQAPTYFSFGANAPKQRFDEW